jgi:hypothetical protein
VRAVQAWAGGRIDNIQAADICQRQAADLLAQLGNPFVRVDNRQQLFSSTGAESLVAALRLAMESEQLAAEGEFRRSAGRQLESRRHVRLVVRQINGFAPLMAADGSIRYLSTVEWQTERLQRLLRALLASEEDLWPK